MKAYSLDELIKKYKPVKNVYSAPSFRLSTPPSDLELLSLGQMTRGEIALVKERKDIIAVYGNEESVFHENVLIHNHPGAILDPSKDDVESCLVFGMHCEYICNDDGIAQIRYKFDEEYLLNHSCAQKASNKKRSRGFKMPEYDLSFVHWLDFVKTYSEQDFWTVFDRRRSWKNIFNIKS